MRTIHLRFALGLLLVLILAGVGVFFLHQHQLGRIALDLKSQVADARSAENSDSAIRLAYQYLEFQPDDADMLIELAGWLEPRGNTRRHLLHVAGMLDRALQIDAKRSDLRRRLVALELRLGQWSECLDHLERLLPESPEDAELLANLGVCQEAIARHADAARSFEKSLRINPKRVATSLDFAALLHRHLNRPDDAKRVLESCVEKSPDSAAARLGLARHYRSTGKLTDACAAAKEAVRLAPNDRMTLTAAAEMEQAASHYVAAREYLARARALAPNDARLTCSLAWLLLCEGKSNEATALLEAVLKDQPDDADTLTLLGDILALDGKIDALERIVAELNRLRQGNAARGWNADYLQARLLMRKSDYAGAARLLEELRLSSARRPGLAKQANYLQAECYDHLHDRARVLEAYRRIIDADQNAGYFRLEYARTLARSAQFPEAVKEFRTALQKTDLPVRTVLEVAGELADRARRFGGDNALKDLERSLESVKADDANVNVVLAKMELLHRRQKTGDALRLAHQYLSRHKNQVEILALQVRLSDSFYGPDRAHSTLSEAEARLGDLAEFRIAKLRLLATRMDASGAAAFALAGELDKFNPEDRSRILTELIAVCGATGDPAKLAEALQRLRSARPDHLAVRSALMSHALATGNQQLLESCAAEIGAVEGSSGKHAELFAAEQAVFVKDTTQAKQLLEPLTRKHPRDPIVCYLNGRVEELDGRTASALKHYSESFDGGFLDQPIEMMMASLSAGNAADRRISVFIEESPLFDRLRLDVDRPLIRCLLPLAAASARSSVMNRLINGNHTASVQDLVWLGRLAQQHGLSRHAETILSKATALAPLSDEAWSARLSFHVSQQDMAKVKELILHAKKSLPAGEGPVILAKALETAGLKSEALGQVQAAVALEPTNTAARRQLIQQLSQTGRIAEARQQLQLLVELSGISVADSAWARRTLAVNLTIAPSLASFQYSQQLLERNKFQGELSDDDRRALATVFASQRNRVIDGRTAREHAVQLISGIKTFSADDEVLFARIYRGEGDGANYLQALARLEHNYPNDYGARLFLAQQALRNDELAKADQHIASLQSLDGARFETIVTRAIRSSLNGQPEAAREVFQHYIRDAADGIPRAARLVRCGHAIVEILQNYPLAELPGVVDKLRDSAIEWYRAGLGRDPQALLQIVALLCKAKRTTEALEFLQSQGVRSAFSFEAQAAAMATVARYGEPNPQQLQMIEKSIKSWNQKQPNSVALLLALADVYEAQKQTPKAILMYRQILQFDRFNINALNNLAWTSIAEPDKMADAQRMIQEAIDRHGPIDELLDTRGRVLFAAGKQAEGLRDLSDAVQNSPSAGRHFQLAVLHRKANHPEAAAEALRQAKRFGLTSAEVSSQDAADYREMMAEAQTPLTSNP